MSRTILLNSSDSLPIPPRTSSRAADHGSADWNHTTPAQSSPLRNGVSSREASPRVEMDREDMSDGSIHTPPSPSPSHLTSDSRGSSYQKRKPVPSLLASPPPVPDISIDPYPSLKNPSGLRIAGNRGGSSIRSGQSGSDAGTPGWREDKDLFFGGKEQQEDNKPTSLPPPPRKSNVRRSPASPYLAQGPSPVASSTAVPISLGKPIGTPAPVVPETEHRRDTFSGGLNINIPDLSPEAMNSQPSIATATSADYETAHTAPSIASSDSTPTASPRIAVLTPDKPLPRVPSTVSLGMSSILADGPAYSMHTRSDSGFSRPSPLTPRLSQTVPATPVIHSSDTVSSAASAKGYSALGGKKFPWHKKKEAKHAHDEDDESVFSVSRVPSKRSLWEAGTHFVRDENGGLVYFGDLFPKWDQDSSKAPTSRTKAEFARHSKTSLPYDPASTDDTASIDPSRPPPRTVMFFIRFFWCGQCQDFLYASVNQLDPVALAKANIRVVIISNGHWKYIKPFRKITKCPFPVYVDGPRKLYKLMGMTKHTMDMGPILQKNRVSYNLAPAPIQIARSMARAPKMPLTSSPGSITQLGGEFILEPGFNCSFAHRMTNFSNHMLAPDVVRLAGCAAPTKEEVKEIELAAEEQAELERLQQQMNSWRTERESELDRIRRKKAERRGVEYQPISAASRVELNLDGTPAFGPTNGERRESVVSAMSFETARPGHGESELEVSLDEAEAGSNHSEEMDGLEGEQDAVNQLSEGELDEKFQQALKFEDEAKERFEEGRKGSVGAA